LATEFITGLSNPLEVRHNAALLIIVLAEDTSTLILQVLEELVTLGLGRGKGTFASWEQNAPNSVKHGIILKMGQRKTPVAGQDTISLLNTAAEILVTFDEFEETNKFARLCFIKAKGLATETKTNKEILVVKNGSHGTALVRHTAKCGNPVVI